MKADIVVIGGGPAGLAAALQAWNNGIKDVWLIERDNELGGILPQCIHDGFGTVIFKESLTGPEYAQRYIDMVRTSGVKVKVDTMVLDVSPEKKVVAVNPKNGVFKIDAKAIVLAMGCRERTRFQIMIPGDRPAGVFTAGKAQRYVNIEGYLPGKRVVIVGSGDVGLIMARRLTLEGANVEGVYEIMSYPSGLNRNVVQCLQDYNIPFHLSRTVTEIKGRKRVESVITADVDEKMQPIKGTEKRVSCDTVILAVGLIPENELSKKAGVLIGSSVAGPVVNEWMETSLEGVFACGNVVHVHDLVDYVSMSAETAGDGASKYVKGEIKSRAKPVQIELGRNICYVVPNQINTENLPEKVRFYLRVNKPEKAVYVKVRSGNHVIHERKMRIVKPSEMLTFEISRKKLAPIKKSGKLSFEIVER